MAWSCGIVGLPNAGKSTLFKALTHLDVTIENYPFSTIDPNKAVVPIPDERLSSLAHLCGSEKVTPATIEIYDVAGLVKGASRGEGLGNQFLGQLREVDLLIHVLAGYSSTFNEDNMDPAMQIEIVNLELSMADIDIITRRCNKVRSQLKSGSREAQSELAFYCRLEEHINKGFALRDLAISKEEKALLDQLSLLTYKEMVYVYNLDEEALKQPDLTVFPPDSPVVPMSARLEAELSELLPDERTAFLGAYGLEESFAEKLLADCYRFLRLSTFYTVKGTEARSWVIPERITAVEAAGKIHTDMKHGFINAEIIPWDILLEVGSLPQARERGLSRIEGRDYQVKDGDVIFFRFRN